MTLGFDQKVPPDRMMSQSCLDYLNLLHAQRVTLKDAGKSGLAQNKRFGMVSAAEGTAGFEERLRS